MTDQAKRDDGGPFDVVSTEHGFQIRCGEWIGPAYIMRQQAQGTADRVNAAVFSWLSSHGWAGPDAIKRDFVYKEAFDILLSRKEAVEKERDSWKEKAYPHMCRMAHQEIGHRDSSHEMCPLCRALADADRLAGILKEIIKGGYLNISSGIWRMAASAVTAHERAKEGRL